MRRRKPDAEPIAATVQRLAVLLGAGVTPVAAWGYLDSGEVVGAIAESAYDGVAVPEAIVGNLSSAVGFEAAAWRAVAIAWAVGVSAGAPLAGTLREVAVALRDLAQSDREIAVALAAPVATARLVMALPAVGVLFGFALGFNTLKTLTTTPVGWACLAIGAVLMTVAGNWNRRLVRSARSTDVTPGLDFDLLAIAVSGGGSIDGAISIVARARHTYSDAEGEKSALDPSIQAVFDLSRRAGVPAGELLRSEATERRRMARADTQRRAQSLSVKLMLPLGVCVLPTFMVLGVVPLLVTVIQSTSVQF